LAQHRVGLREIEGDRLEVRYSFHLLGYINLRTSRLEPACQWHAGGRGVTHVPGLKCYPCSGCTGACRENSTRCLYTKGHACCSGSGCSKNVSDSTAKNSAGSSSA